MNCTDEYIGKWIQHFRDLGADIAAGTEMSYMGWKSAIAIWQAEPYHEIARALGVKELKINLDDELFFRTSNVPEHETHTEWSIWLLKNQVPVFRKKHGLDYSITEL